MLDAISCRLAHLPAPQDVHRPPRRPGGLPAPRDRTGGARSGMLLGPRPLLPWIAHTIMPSVAAPARAPAPAVQSFTLPHAFPSPRRASL